MTVSASLLVIAPHADDDILGAGAILARAAAAGQRVGVVFATDGSRSDPGVAADVLVARRRSEARAGLVRLLGRDPPTLFLDAPDGGLSGTAVDLDADAPLARFVAALAPTDIMVTDPADGHPDHKAAFGLATRLVSAGFGARLWAMPVSQRVDGIFDPRGFERLAVGELAETKAAALACHASQIDTRTGFYLTPGVQAAFNDAEYRRLAFDRADAAGDAVPAAHFDEMFAANADPWGYDTEAYERDRFRRTVAALADRRYADALELGCANGALTAQLAPLCARLLATDASAPALAAARRRLATEELKTVRLEQRRLPGDVPGGMFDLIVASDMLYYLGLDGVVTLMRALDTRAAPGCRLLIASYLGETDTRLTGEMSAETAIAHLPGWRRCHAERTARLRLDVLERA